MTTAKSAGTKGIGTKDCKRTLMRSIPRQGKKKPLICLTTSSQLWLVRLVESGFLCSFCSFKDGSKCILDLNIDWIIHLS